MRLNPEAALIRKQGMERAKQRRACPHREAMNSHWEVFVSAVGFEEARAWAAAQAHTGLSAIRRPASRQAAEALFDGGATA